MMVTFVSQCEKNALKKTRRVLDAYANRIGDNTWQTVITQEGLQAVKKLLRKTASKNTAVSCHWLRSRSRSELVWVVGKREGFNVQGVVPVNSTKKEVQESEQFSLNTSVIALLASIGGLFHDVGKAMALFQGKLERSVTNAQGLSYEPYRHEWVSLRLFQAFVGDSDDKQWLEALANINNSAEQVMLENLNSLRDGIDTNIPNPFNVFPPVAKIVAWLIVSHHKLPQYPKGEDNPPNFDNVDGWLTDSFEACWNSPQCLKDDWQARDIEANWIFPYGTPLKSAHWQTQASVLASKALRSDRLFLQPWFDQHFTAHMARLSLMLSDHYYSSKKEVTATWRDRNYQAYANTDVDEQGKKYRKQKLDEHNIAVGVNAGDIAYTLPRLREDLPAVKPNKAFTKKVPQEYQEDFGWQDTAYKLACNIKDGTKKHGFFGISKASTGKGKTRANARIMYGLSDDGECRFSVALGLRTLTLQTADAIKLNLDLGDELALLIGSQAVRDLHLQTNEDESNACKNRGSESAESLLKDEISLIESMPVYTGAGSKWFEHDPKILKLIQAPVLVSTIDYLMPACEGVRGGRQIAPTLRLLTSDLVLDEPDDFGLDDLPALCRLVNWAGMLGSRVLLSTATISPTLSSALFSAYQSGRKHYTQVNGEQGENEKICCAWFDEFKNPQSKIIATSNEYEQAHSDFVDKRIKQLKKQNKPLRQAKIIPISVDESLPPSALMAKTIHQSMIELHTSHHITLGNKNVSIGLVRMANIDPLVQVTKSLVAMDVGDDAMMHFCVYHSQLPLLQRSNIEKQLDAALSRHDEQQWREKSSIEKIIAKYPQKNHIFIVIATAVAEVGRDHDYDWAVVEPSSMRSIIQLAGRIQRHRKQVPSTANIHVLSKNYKGLKGKSPCFEKPGFETRKLRYSSTDLTDLLAVNELNEVTAIARIKMPYFDGKSFIQEDKNYPPKISHFNLLEHISQHLKLQGNDNNNDYAAQWWKTHATWCGEIQHLQPFRFSPTPNDDFCQEFTRTNKLIWKKKQPKTTPITYQNTEDIATTPECIKLGESSQWWGSFNLEGEIDKLILRLNKNQSYIMKKFTHLSLRKLDEDTSVQWQCHPQLGVYQILKKDEY